MNISAFDQDVCQGIADLRTFRGIYILWYVKIFYSMTYVKIFFYGNDHWKTTLLGNRNWPQIL